MQPSMEEWRELYEAAVAFRDAAPWQWMWDSDLFGVQDPESGEIGYCCVMGRRGEHYALGVYLGSVGLAGYWEMLQGPPPETQDPAEILALETCLMASYEDRTQLRKPDLEVIKELGLKFRGRNAWPLFRSYRPGYEPWYVTASEARFLAVCLRQALDVAERFRQDPNLLPEPKPQGPYLVRVPEAEGWRDTLQRPAPVRPQEGAALPPVDAARVERLRKLPATRGVLQMDYFFAGGVIKEAEDERPWLAQVVLAADADSGLILGVGTARLDEAPAVMAEQLQEVIEKVGRRPGRVEVRREPIRALLKPLADRLGVRLVRVRRLPAIEEAQEGFGTFLGR